MRKTPWVNAMSVNSAEEFAAHRRRMVAGQLESRDITNQAVLEAMGRVERHLFAPREFRHLAYSDQPLPIGYGQTISQPYVVALMTQLAAPRQPHRALDIGTGSGYQAAILSLLCKEIHSVEIVPPLAKQATARLRSLGYKNVEVHCADGYQGWPRLAPYDVVMVAAAPERIPPPLLEQLAIGGRLVIPVGRQTQSLRLIEKKPDGACSERVVAPVAFVPMTGQAEARHTAG